MVLTMLPDTTCTFAALFCLILLQYAPISSAYSYKHSCSLDSYTVHPDNGSGIWPYLSYKSSNVTPPHYLISQTNQSLSPGHVFTTPQNSGLFPGEEQEHAYISRSEGGLIWAGPEGQTSNFKKQHLHGRPVLSYWTGDGNAAAAGQVGHGYGHVDILDTKYDQIYTVCPKINITLPFNTTADCAADVHESYITPHNTILVTAYNITQTDLTSVGGPEDGWVFDSLAVEVDIETNEALFIWSPLAHVPVNASRYARGASGQSFRSPYDWFHMNSIQSFDGGFLINSRHTWTTYFVNHSGEIEWQITGDTGGDFGPIPEEARFSWEHDARISNTSKENQLLLTYFANNNDGAFTLNASLGLGLLLDFPPNKTQSPQIHSRVVDDAHPVYSYAEGSYQILPDGNSFLGYGIKPFLKEFGPDGEVRWTAEFGYDNNRNTSQSYRAFKQPWHATPSTPLDLVVQQAVSTDALNSCAAGSPYRGYVSWNGATDVKAYAVYTGTESTKLTRVATVTKKGFETEFVIPADSKYVQVAAVERGAQTAECGKSAVVTVQ